MKSHYVLRDFRTLLFVVALWIPWTVVGATCVIKDKVSLQLNWLWQAQFAGFQAASSLGYFDEECLSVQIRQGEATFDGLSEVSEGRAVFGNAWTSGVATTHSAGTNLTVIMQQFQRSGMRIVSRLRPDIQTFQDLDNKTFSGWMVNLLDVSPRAAFTKHNMTNVNLVPQSFTPFKLFATDGTAVDAVSVMVYNELAQIFEVRNPQTGMLYQPDELKIFDLNTLGAGMLEDNVFVRSDWLEDEENKNITRRFLRATAKGWIYCRDNEEACKSMLYDHGPHQEWMMREVNRLIWPSPLGVGFMDPGLLNTTLNMLNITGHLHHTSSPYPLSDSSYMRWALDSLESQGYDVRGQNWSKSQLHFCMNSGETAFHVCDDIEATICPAGYSAIAANQCVPCPPGSFAPHNGTGNSCQACPPGTFSSQNGGLKDPNDYLDEPGGVLCSGCPSGTRVGADGRVICGKVGFEDSLVHLIVANKALVGAWAGAMGLAGFLFFYIKRTEPTADAVIMPSAVASILETILDAVFLNLLVQQGRMNYFAIAVTGFGGHFLLNILIVGVFIHHEFRLGSVRRWTEQHVNALPPVVMLSVMNPELLGILSSKVRGWKWTQAPFSPKGLAALRFSTFAAFVAGKIPQVCVEILILQRDGWHLDPFLAAVTTLALLTKGVIHYFVLNILILYKKRRGNMSSKGSQNGSSLSNIGHVEAGRKVSRSCNLDPGRLRDELVLAKRRVKELEELLRAHGDVENASFPPVLATGKLDDHSPSPLSQGLRDVTNKPNGGSEAGLEV
ncbi:uncharacterized protein SPPG_06813 [Spizellomyces punctatus DAOM BR117]|uniref:Thiamine pyrimidine synthase n=1 Tax=Spizellomyces punctatus (strain DAOM BR117) TaxID=645134 RepID=A0A0L0HAS2_SPIPD|nr:uncharacterized protein SPPG_06813 [Spizellomyces punctatus DAOM BR117]KNC97818.1 hypothetical protein SPPG_06813 [Spizellomyces punctatus DAOM BR117]|eukprot:XP_016605858.1 hypothetical protein SPPG_06813 [Spizellomyces punctatus DAOM BR117]